MLFRSRDPETYGAVAERLSHKAEKTQRRRKEQRQREKAAQARARKPWAPPAK